MLRVLVVDDSPEFQTSYQELLLEQGHVCTIAGTRQVAAERWREEGPFEVVLLDKRLQGPSGPDDGLDLLADLRFWGAKVILVTGFADEASVRAAFAQGVHDYLEKGPLLPTLLRVKLEQIDELVRARDRGLPKSEERIRELWRMLRHGAAHARGRRLEDLLLSVMTSIPGLQESWRNLRAPTEELDLVLRNRIDDPFWQKQPSYVLVECKNWSRPVGTSEIAWFADKVRERPEARLGFFIAPEGFSESVGEKVRGYRREGLALVLVEGSDLERLVLDAVSRRKQLEDLHARFAV